MSKKAGGKGAADKKDKKDKAPKAPAIPLEDEEGYSNFSVEDATTNLILLVEGKKLFVHRDVIIVNCPGLKDVIDPPKEEDPAGEADGGLPGNENVPSASGGNQLVAAAPRQDNQGSGDYGGQKGDTQSQGQGQPYNQNEFQTVQDPNQAASAAVDQVQGEREETKVPKEPQEVTLEDKSYEVVLELAKCIYPPHKPITDENVEQLVGVVGEWEVNSLKEPCEQVLLAREPSIKLLLLAQKSELERVCELVAEKLVGEHTVIQLQKEEGFEELSFTNKARIYRSRITHLQSEQEKLDETSALVYSLTKCIVPIHKCSSVPDNRFGYLVLTTTGDDGRKKRETFSDSALIYHNEINPKCKDCVLCFGQDCYKEILQLDSQGAFDHLKKKFEAEKKPRGKGQGAGGKK